jgi:ribosomal-protein-alanine N-acetyltransferase
MTPRDVGAVAAIEAASFGAEAWPPEAFRALLRAFDRARPSRGAMWVAVDPGTAEILGYAGVEVSALCGEADLINIAVSGAHRRRGTGQALVARALGFCRRLSVELLWLRVRASNRGARRFYRFLGFTERGRFARYYLEPEEPVVLMAVELYGDVEAPRD